MALLPGPLAAAVGQVGPQAPAVGVDVVDVEHPYLAGLYEQPADYRTVLVQRRFPLAVEPAPARVLMRLTDGGALLAAKPYGRGAVVLCATSCTPQWSNLPLTGLFLPLVNRVCLTSAAGAAAPSYPAGSAVSIQPPGPVSRWRCRRGRSSQVTPPPAGDAPPRGHRAPDRSRPDAPQAVFTATDRAGRVPLAGLARARGGEGLSGAFAVNADGGRERPDGDGRPRADRRAAQGRLAERGASAAAWRRFVRPQPPGPPGTTGGTCWWRLVIVLLVVEAVLANRLRPASSRPAAAGTVAP